MDIRKEIGVVLGRYLRKRFDEAAGETRAAKQDEFAKLIGVTRPAITHYLNGTRSTSFKMIEKVLVARGPEDVYKFFNDLADIASEVRREMDRATIRYKEGGRPKIGSLGDVAADIAKALKEDSSKDDVDEQLQEHKPERTARPRRRTRNS